MALHSLPSFNSIVECRETANQLMLDPAQHILGKHLIAWADISEGRYPAAILDELSQPSEARAAVPIPYHIGWLLTLCNRSQDAINQLAIDSEARPDRADLQLLNGICLQKVRSYAASQQVLEGVLKKHPNTPLAHHFLTSSYLSNGQIEAGFRTFINGRTTNPEPWEEAFYSRPEKLWQGQSLEGKRIVILGNESDGDQILASKYAVQLQKLNTRIVGMICTSERLVRLLRKFKAIHRVQIGVSDTDPFANYDYFIPVELLPHQMLSYSQKMVSGTSLSRHPLHKAHIKQPLASSDKPLLGICWRNENETNRTSFKNRATANSINLKTLELIIEKASQRFNLVCLQKDVLPMEQALLERFSVYRVPDKDFENYSSLAEWINCLHEVITVDSPVAHIAGTYEVPTRLLLSYAPDWKWHFDLKTTPWYPHTRLYRTRIENDWRTCLPDLANDLNVSADAIDLPSMRQVG